MRQSGILAAAGLYALDHNVARLAEDHANARSLADKVRALPNLTLDQSRVDSNLVFFDCAETGLSAADLSDALRARGVLIGAMDRHRLRAVTHLDVDAAAVDAAGEALEGRRKRVGEGACEAPSNLSAGRAASTSGSLRPGSRCSRGAGLPRSRRSAVRALRE